MPNDTDATESLELFNEVQCFLCQMVIDYSAIHWILLFYGKN